MKKFLRKIFSVSNQFNGLKKYKVIYFLFFKIRFRVRNVKDIKKYFETIKPRLLPTLPTEPKRPPVFISIAAIYKDEPDLKEWIEYHRIIGVERFYLYDNGSTDNSRELLQPYIDEGIVVYHYIDGECMQMPVYRDAVCRTKGETHWLALIDIDEYLCPVATNNISEILKDFEKYPAIGVNWIVFDSNGLKKRPDCPVIEAFTRVKKDYQKKANRHIKTILKPEEVFLLDHPHFSVYKRRGLAVTENYEKIGIPYAIKTSINAFTDTNSVSKIRINHYHSKSLEEYIQKLMRGDAATGWTKIVMKRVNFQEETTHDYVIQKYLPELKSRMNKEEKVI